MLGITPICLIMHRSRGDVTQAGDFGRGFLAAAASDIRRAQGALAADQTVPLLMSLKQVDRVPSGVVALVSRCQLAQTLDLCITCT